jgi:hypothetical protein
MSAFVSKTGMLQRYFHHFKMYLRIYCWPVLVQILCFCISRWNESLGDQRSKQNRAVASLCSFTLPSILHFLSQEVKQSMIEHMIFCGLVLWKKLWVREEL